jgi:hypothetical protein
LTGLAFPLSGQDRPFKIISEPLVRYPEFVGYNDSPPGSVTMVIGVSQTGEFLDALVIAYTHIEYAREARLAVENWTYRAAMVGGETVGTRVDITLEFEPDGVVRRLAPVNTANRLFERSIPKNVTQVYYPERELDTPLAFLAAPTPPSVDIPEDMQVTVDFYIDQEGKPRLPAILSMDDPILAEIALETIREWRFAPPTSDGEPVITRARQQFVFHGQGDS